MFDFFKKKKPVETPKAEEPKAKSKKKTAKELATEAGEPYVAVLGMDIDYNNLSYGSFELDWNDKFVSNLIRAGYVGKTDADIVDMWFQNVCRNVVMETWEQEQAIRNSGIYVQSRDIGNGRSEIS
jgi:microsomal dipeptidase-like Zn-dependent dipeptidase